MLHSNTGVRTCMCEINIWLGSGGASNNLGNFFTDWFQILTHRCIRIRTCFYIRDGMGWDGMGCHATGTGMGWDGTERHVMGRDGMGRNGMALSHSNAWPGTASIIIRFRINVQQLITFSLCIPCESQH
jgi:hypothetical protein